MSGSRTEQEKNFIVSLISGLANREEPPTKAEVETKAKQLAAVFDFEGDLGPLVDEAMIEIDTRMGAGVSLVDTEAKHDEEWVNKREIIWTYSDAYERHLKNEKRHPTMVRSLSDVGKKILGHLQDPQSDGAWNRRGMVIGHVQSGKTANYIGVIAKAADAGYKFIIVSAGIHSNLRKQTQERIDEAFIGRSSDPEKKRELIGVGLSGNYPHPATLTNINDDFNKTTAAKSGWKINDFSKPIILVIKKNVRTLESLHKWLKELNAQGDGRIGDVPMLFIDDEADNASINTNKPDIDPTRTNAMIRSVLSLFAKSCYVGYTATPFANIFINPDAYADDVREDLFPRHFIYSLDPPTSYFGPHKVFLNEATSPAILKKITDCEDYIPSSHKNGDPVPDLPPSLYAALNEFIVARTIRNLRGQSGSHCSMLINVSRFVSTQRMVRDFISEREKNIRAAVKANYMMPEATSAKNEYMAGLRKAYDEVYSGCGFSWDEVRKGLFSTFDHLRIYVVNSKSDEPLDYKKYEKEGVGLTAVAIGGLSLSRGLTIEGLTVSYMYRNTKMYDTLLQMGRWFGYRPNFEDLCRVHLSGDSINWYTHIAGVTEELRGQIVRMRRAGMTPEQFGLYVQSHPDAPLLVTATNKMRSGQKITVKQNFTGELRESWKVATDPDISAENEALIAELWRDGFGGKAVEPTRKGWIIRDADQEVVQDFLGRFKTHRDFTPVKASIMAYLERIQEEYPKADVLLISLDRGGEKAEPFKLGAQERSAKDAADGSWLLNRYRVASRGDEKLGLSEAQLREAARIALEDETNESKDKAPSDTHYRAVRDKPLLMVHVLAPTENEALKGQRIPAFGVSFPHGLFHKAVEIVANRIWVEQMYGSMDDDPDLEEDYDE